MPRRFAVASLVFGASIGLAIGCGSFATSNEIADGSTGDGPANTEGGLPDGGLADGESEEDAGPPITCGRKGDFANPTKLAALGLTKIESARFFPSTGHVYLSGIPDAGGAMRLVVRKNEASFATDLGWLAAVSAGVVEDNHPMPASSKLKMLFESKRKQDNTNNEDRLYLASRANETSSYDGTVLTVKIPSVPDLKALEEPWLLGNQIYFSLTTSSVADRIWSGTFNTETATIENAAVLAELLPNGSGELGYPIVTKDHRRIYYAATNPGGGRDIWTATRPALTAKFNAPTKLDYLGTGVYPTWVSDDDCDLYFIKDKTELYRVSRQ